MGWHTRGDEVGHVGSPNRLFDAKIDSSSVELEVASTNGGLSSIMN
jgi:hypothetical protein